MSAAGTVTVRFDVQGNENLLKSFTTMATGATQAQTGVTKLQSTLGGIGVGNLGPLNNIATSVNNMGAGMGAAETKVSSFRTKLASIGSQLGQNATSFGVATASIWGVYNAYDSLEKVQIRAHGAAVRVSTLETTLASLIERRRIAMVKGNLTGEEMNILNEKIANTQQKLSVAQERSADVAGDLQEAWAGFISTVGPQAIAATGSVIQLANTFKGSFANTGGVFNTVKGALTGLISSFRGTQSSALLLQPALGNLATGGASLKTVAAGLVAGISPLAAGFKGLGGEIKRDVLPAVTSLMGTGGLSGLTDKFKGVGTSAVGLKGSLLGIGIATAVIGGVTIAALELAKAMNQVASQFTNVKEPVSVLEASVDKSGKSLEAFNLTLAETEAASRAGISPMIVAFDAVFGTKMTEKILTNAGALDKEGKILVNFGKSTKAVITPSQELAAAQDKLNIALKDPALKSHQTETAKAAKAALDHAQAEVDRLKAVETTAAAVAKFSAVLAENTNTWWLQAKAFEGTTKSINLASKSYLDVHDTIVASNPDIQKNIENTRHQKQLADALKAANLGLRGSLEDYNNTLKASGNFSELFGDRTDVARGAMAKFAETNKVFIHGIELTQEELILTQDAEDGNIEALDKLAHSTINTTSAMNGQLVSLLVNKAESINYTRALDDLDMTQRLMAQGFEAGIIQARDFFDNLVKGTEQEAVFNASLAEGAYSLGINSEMLAFSSTKMQELITTTYEQSQAFSEMAIAAATDTSFLKDKVLIQAVLQDAMIKGAQAANDWTISMIGSTQAAKDEHGQLVQLTADMTGLPVPLSLTSDQLKEVMTNFQETGDAAGSLANVVTENLAPAFDLVSGLLDAESFKDFGKSLKELALPKGFLKAGKDMDDAMKGMFNASKNAEKASNAIKLLIGVDLKEEDFKKKLGKVKGALEDLQKVPGTTPAIDNILEQAEKMNRTDFIKHAGSLNMIFDAIDQYGFLPDDIAAKAIELFNKENTKVDPSGGNAAKGLMKVIDVMDNGIPVIDKFGNTIGQIGTITDSMSEAVKEAKKPLQDFVGSFSIGGKSLKDSKVPKTGGFEGKLSSDPDMKKQLDDLMKRGQDGEITPPKPVVFPPPDLSNILAGVSKAEIMMSEMVKYAAGLSIIFPEPITDAIITGVSKAQIAASDLVAYVAGLTIAFPQPNVDAVITGVSQAQIVSGDLVPYIAGLVLAFPEIGIENISASSIAAQGDIGAVATFITAMEMAFQPPSIVAVANQSSAAKKAITAVETHIKNTKLPFQAPNIVAIANQCSAAKKAITAVQDHINGLKLKFPKPDISQIESQVDKAQDKINSLKGKNVTNTVTTKYVDSGSKPKAGGGVEYRETATNTTWGEAGPEVAVFMPLTRAGQPSKGNYDIKVPTPVLDTSGLRNSLRMNREPMPVRSGQRSGPTVVNVTTDVYLFPGSAQFKKFVKSIILDEFSRMPVA